MASIIGLLRRLSRMFVLGLRRAPADAPMHTVVVRLGQGDYATNWTPLERPND